VCFFFALLALKNRVGAWIWAILELLLVEGLMFLFDRKTTLSTSKQQLNVAYSWYINNFGYDQV